MLVRLTKDVPYFDGCWRSPFVPPVAEKGIVIDLFSKKGKKRVQGTNGWWGIRKKVYMFRFASGSRKFFVQVGHINGAYKKISPHKQK